LTTRREGKRRAGDLDNDPVFGKRKSENNGRQPEPPTAGRDARMTSPPITRRTLLQGTAGAAALAGIGSPAIVRAQGDAIRIGHLTPITGFLGPVGEFAQMGVRLAAEEVNAAGGVMGRKVDLVMEDSVNPQTASAKPSA
jgi:ABC-type branched-subunit amino acid transport system substrate-binding protein